MLLPTEKTKPITDLAFMPILIYGPPKIGKTTWCAQAEDAFFIPTEQGQNHVSVYQPTDENGKPKFVSSWEDLIAVYKELKANGQRFHPIVIDTVDNAYRFCREYFCRKLNMDHPSDLGYGKGWDAVNDPFRVMLNKFSLLGQGLILVSHGKQKDVKTRTGDKTKWVPAMSGSIADAVAAFVEIILFCDIEETKDETGEIHTRRVMRTKASPDYEAGGRLHDLPDPIDLDYHIFVKAVVKAKEIEAQREKAKTKGATK